MIVRTPWSRQEDLRELHRSLADDRADGPARRTLKLVLLLVLPLRRPTTDVRAAVGGALLLVVPLLAGCGGPGSPSVETSAESPSTSGSSVPATQQQTAQPDLTIVGATLKPMQGTPFVSITVKNIGQGPATNVDGTCSYQCPLANFSVTGVPFLQGGYLMPGAGTSGLLPVSPSCTPDVFIRLDCIVDPENAYAEINESNNRWIGDVKIR